MPHEPTDAPVPEKSKSTYYVGLVVAILVVGALAVFVFPNILALTNEGPTAVDDLEVQVPTDDGLEPAE